VNEKQKIHEKLAIYLVLLMGFMVFKNDQLNLMINLPEMVCKTIHNNQKYLHLFFFPFTKKSLATGQQRFTSRYSKKDHEIKPVVLSTINPMDKMNDIFFS